MKHGVRIWQKKLNRSPSHRASLMKNLLTELVKHEQIETTVAKAQFVHHEMERLINLSKGDEESKKLAGTMLNIAETNVPKLIHVLAKRYQNRRGGYVRVLRNGFRKSGSDRAPLAIVELINNPNDIVYHFARKQLSSVKEQLEKVESEKYHRTSITLRNPTTGAIEELIKLNERSDITGQEKKKYSRIELSLHKKLIKYKKSLVSYPIARACDDMSELSLKELLDQHDEINPKENSSKSLYLPPREKIGAALAVPARSKYSILAEAYKESVAETIPKGLELEGSSSEVAKDFKKANGEEGPLSKQVSPAFGKKYFGSWFK